MRRLNIIFFAVLALVIVGHFGKAHWDYREHHHAIVRALQANNMQKASALMGEKHDWNLLLAELSMLQNPLLYQRVFDIQFINNSGIDFDYFDNTGSEEGLDVVKKLVSSGAKPTVEHLVVAIQQNRMKTALFFLEQGVPANATWNTHSPIRVAADCGDIELVRALVQRGANVNQVHPTKQYNPRWCPLTAATLSGQSHVASFLLSVGADPFLESPRQTPAWKSVRQIAHSNPSPGASATWRLVKPIVEKKLGHAITD